MNNEEDDIEDEIKSLVPAYLENRKRELIILKKALSEKDMATISKIAHNIKGTALSYGQLELNRNAQNLSAACKNSDWAAIEKVLSEIETFLFMPS
jgi:HPt (histidine-containing phosphotransfer) domain-containing protein